MKLLEKKIRELSYSANVYLQIMQMAYISPANQEQAGWKDLDKDFEKIYLECSKRSSDIQITPFSGFLSPNMDMPYKVGIPRQWH